MKNAITILKNGPGLPRENEYTSTTGFSLESESARVRLGFLD